MTHFKVEIQLPLRYNPRKGQKQGKKISENKFFDTYEELLKLAGGVHTTNTPIIGSWICPETEKRYNDSCIVFCTVVESDDRMTVTNVTKVKELLNYKEKILKERFKQQEIFMVATRCVRL